MEVTDRAEPLLRLTGASKRFGHTQALHGVDLEVHRGESVAVLGENGAGKSTLMKIIAGVYLPDAGEISFDGQQYAPSSPADANRAGIVMVHQEPTFLPHLTVLQNLFAGRELTGRFGGIRWRAMRAAGRVLFADVGLDEDLLDRRMGTLSLGEQQLILIARAFHHDAQLLILDEPTSILTETETERLFGLVRRWLQYGSVLYITHRIRELPRVAQRAIVLRDGHLVGELEVDGDIEDEVVQLMSGRALATLSAVAERRKERHAGAEPALRIEGLHVDGLLHDVSLQVAPGEVLGLYGLVGAGRTEVALSLLGELPVTSGRIEVLGMPYEPRSMARAVERGLAYVPEDRKTMGLFPYLSVRENLAAAALGLKGGPLSVIDRSAERELTDRYLAELDIKTASIDDRITTLSGGSQQKVILARWLATEPKVLVLDEPTRGIDVTTKSEIHRLIGQLAEGGLAVLLISSELPEMLALSDRIMVLREGRVVVSLSGAEIGEEPVLRAALGSRRFAALPVSAADGASVAGMTGAPGTAVAPSETVTSRGGVSDFSARLDTARRVAIWFLLAAELVLFSLLLPSFLSTNNIANVVVNSAGLAIVAAAMTFVIILGGIDVSVGSMVGVLAWVTGWLTTTQDLPVVAILGLVVALGAVMGTLNGTIVTKGRMTAIIATLGMLFVWRSVLFALWGGSDLFAPPVASWLGGQRIGVVPVVGLIALVVFLVLGLVAVYRRFGRDVYAVGNDRQAARLNGIPVDRRIIGAFALLGALVGLAAVMQMARVGVVQAFSGKDFELGVIAAVLIGGTSITGGRGSLPGTLGGVLFVAVLQNGIVLAGVPPLWNGVALGAFILIAVGADVLLARASGTEVKL